MNAGGRKLARCLVRGSLFESAHLLEMHDAPD
jgi:hypothetical protein